MITYTLDELNAVAGPTKLKPTGVEVRDPNEYTLAELNVAAGRTGDNPAMIDDQTPKMLAAFEGQKLPVMGESDRAAWQAMKPGERALKAYEAFGVPIKDMGFARKVMESATNYYLNPPASTEQPQMRAMTDADNPDAMAHAVRTGLKAFGKKPLMQSIPLVGGLVRSADEAYERDMDAEALRALENYDYQDTPRDKKLLAAHLARFPQKRREAAQEQFEAGMHPIASGIGGGARDVVPYILEFAITRGVASRMLEGVKAKIAAGTASELEKRLVSEAATVGLQTAINPEVPVNALERIREGDDILNSAMKSFASTAISNASESAGGVFDKGLSAVGKAARKIPMVDKAVEKAGKVVKVIPGGGKAGQTLDKLGVQSLPSELLEEQLDATGQAVADTDLARQNNPVLENIHESIMSPQEAAITAGVLAVPGLAHGALRVGRAKTPQTPITEESSKPAPAETPQVPSIDKATKVTYETDEGTVTFEPRKPVETPKEEASPFETPEFEQKVDVALERAQKWVQENEGKEESVKTEAVAENAIAPTVADHAMVPTIQENLSVEPVKENLTAQAESVPVSDEEKERLLNDVEASWSQPEPVKTPDPTKLIVEASRAGVALTKADVAGVMKKDPAAMANIQAETARRQTQSAEESKARKTLDQAMKRVWKIEKARNYDVAKKELGKNIRKKKREQIEAVLKSDVEYQEALSAMRKAQTAHTKAVNDADRSRKILRAEAGKVDKDDLAAAPLHTLAPVVKAKIQEHARYLLAQQKNQDSPTARALKRVIKDAGSDNTAAAIAQKERIIGHLTGKRGIENVSGKWTKAQADELLDLYTSQNGPKHAMEAIASIDRGEPDFVAKRIIREIESRIDSGTDEGLPMQAVNTDNPDAEAAPEHIARAWLEQIAGKSVPKESNRTSNIQRPTSNVERPKDLLGRPIIDPIGKEQKDLGFTQSQSGETPIETESGKAWVTAEGKLKPEADTKAEAAIEKEITEKGQGVFETAKSIDPRTQRLQQAKRNVNIWLQGGMLHSGLPLNILKDFAVIGSDYIRQGIRTFHDFKARLIREYGESIKGHAKAIWDASLKEYARYRRNYPESVSEEVKEQRRKTLLTSWEQTVEAATKRLKAFFGGRTMFTGIPLNVMHDLTVVGANLFYKGFKKAGPWATELVKLLGTKRLTGLDLNKVFQASQIYHNDRVRAQKLKLMKDKYPDLADGHGGLFDVDELTPESIFARAQTEAGKAIGKEARGIVKDAKAQDREEAKAARQEEKAQERIAKAKKQLTYDLSLRAKQERAAQVLGQLADELNPIGGLRTFWQDPHRVFKAVFGQHYGKARKLILAPFDQGKGAFIRDQERWLGKVWNTIVMKHGIRAGSRESADLQRFGENKIGFQALENRYGKAKAEKIRLADLWFRDAYDELLGEVNESRRQVYPNQPDKIIPKREDYYRHFQELAEGLGALKNIFDTPANISSSMALQSEYTKPRSKWLPFAQKRSGDNTKYDAVGGFLDYLKYWAYAKHIDPHAGAFRSLAQELAVQMEGKTNEGRLNPFIKYLDNFAGELTGKTNPIDRSVQDMLTNKDGGRRFFRGLNWTNTRLKANLILGNVSSSLSQFANVPVGAARTGPINATLGFGRSVAGVILGNEPMTQSNFLKERYFDGYSRFDAGILKYPKAFAKWMLTVLDEVGTKYLWNCFYEEGKRKGVSDPVAYADGMTRSIVAGRGIGEVPLAQKSKVVQLFAPFQLEVANFWWVIKDMLDERAFGQLIMLAVYDWLFNRAIEYLRGSPVLYDPIQATIDASKEFMKEKNTVRGAFKFAGREVGEFLANVPGGNIVAKVMEGRGSPYKESLFGKNSPSRFGVGLIPELFNAVPNAVDLVSEPSWKGAEKVGMDLLSIAPPFGGKQIKKTYEGTNTFLAGEERDAKGRLKWKVDPAPGSLLNSILFGKYATKGAKEYLEKRNR